MKRNPLKPLCLLTSLAFHEELLADIAFDPAEPPPWDEQSSSQSQPWTTIAGTGLLLCAFIAVLIVRVKKARQSKPENNTGASRTSGESGRS